MMQAAIMCAVALGISLLIFRRPLQRVTVPRIIRPRVSDWLAEAGLAHYSPFVVFAAVSGVAALVAALMSVILPLRAVGPLAGVASILLMWVGIESSRSARRRRARAAWPDIIDGLRSSLRSGATVAEALGDARPHVPIRWRPDWDNCTSELARGVAFRIAVRELKRRIADPVADTLCESLIIAREIGGTELPRIVADLGSAVRADARVRNEVRSRQAWVRHAARLGVAAPWLVVAMIAGRSETRAAFNSEAGVALLVVGFAATVVAYVVMTAISSLPEPDRWLVGGGND